jgi:uncharacterized membrane protein
MDQIRRYTRYAAMCFFVMAAIGPIKYFFLPIEAFLSQWMIIVFNLVAFCGIGILVWQGYSWTKYVLAVLAVIGLLRLEPLINELSSLDIVSINALVDIILLICATLMLFAAAPKPTTDRIKEEHHEKGI